MEPSIECALARVTTGEWADAMRSIFGEYRPATGIDGQKLGLTGERVDDLRRRLQTLTEKLGHRPRLVIGKPGLDGHSNGAEVIAVAARHVGFDVIYGGIRLTPEDIARTAVEEDADIIGISILSGSHMELTEQLYDSLVAQNAADIPVVVGGIIPPDDAAALMARGIRAVFTPSDYELMDVMSRMTSIVEALHATD
jgi:(2R)-ethylmalonyl-CoA mutase